MLCDKKISVKLKAKIYHMVVRLALLYRSECWLIKKIQMRKLLVAKIRMIMQMCGHTIMDKIRNEIIRGKVGVAPREDKMRETKLGWLAHTKRRDINALVRRCERNTF